MLSPDITPDGFPHISIPSFPPERNALILGTGKTSGGREDALAYALRNLSQTTGEIYIAPGNGGTERFSNTHRLNLNTSNFAEVFEAARDLNIGLVIPGPEAILVGGIVDAFKKNPDTAHIPILGLSKKAAQMEGSKAFSARFAQEYGIPMGYTEIFDDYEEAMDFLTNRDNLPIQFQREIPVIKGDGLADGKAVIVPDEWAEAEDALYRMMVQKEFGQAGETVLIQERLRGFELSFIVVNDGVRYVSFPVFEDHKQLHDNDKGPNTGGIGVSGPHPPVDNRLIAQIEQSIVRPTLSGMMQEEISPKGILYFGIMATENGPQLLEYNGRFGDPEVQGIVSILSEEKDFGAVLESAAEGNIEFEGPYPTTGESAVVVTLVESGYPGLYEKGHVVYNASETEKLPGAVVFHAGTEKDDQGQLVTAGGRNLNVGATAATIEEAHTEAYNFIGEKKDGVYFKNMDYRTDIGMRKRT